jgi:threonine/homoserine/homoserine lactone efflux protein
MDSYWLFATIWFVAAATPGADTMLLLTTSLSAGWRSAVAISIGITAAKVVLLVLAFFGLTALLDTVPQAFMALKIFGCLFLLWRAFKLWNSKPATGETSKTGFWGNLSLAFSVGVTNPQAMLFYIAVVPQVAETTNPWILSLIIAVGFSLISAFYIGLAVPIRAWMSRGANQRLLNRIVAIVFASLAVIVVLR